MKFWSYMNGDEKRNELKTQLYNYKVKLSDDELDYLVFVIDGYCNRRLLKRADDIDENDIPF